MLGQNTKLQSKRFQASKVQGIRGRKLPKHHTRPQHLGLPAVPDRSGHTACSKTVISGSCIMLLSYSKTSKPQDQTQVRIRLQSMSQFYLHCLRKRIGHPEVALKFPSNNTWLFLCPLSFIICDSDSGWYVKQSWKLCCVFTERQSYTIRQP